MKQAAAELGLHEVAIKQDLGRVLLKLEELQEQAIRAALEPKRKAADVSDADRDAALDLLRNPHLVDRILADFQTCGVVGEETNKLLAYLAAVSRKLDGPLAVIINRAPPPGRRASWTPCSRSCRRRTGSSSSPRPARTPTPAAGSSP